MLISINMDNSVHVMAWYARDGVLCQKRGRRAGGGSPYVRMSMQHHLCHSRRDPLRAWDHIRGKLALCEAHILQVMSQEWNN